MEHVPRNQDSPEFPKRDTKLYSIVGCFDQPSEELTAMAFGGYFRYDVLDKLVVDGQLVDMFGPSTIEGLMQGNALVFSKKYAGRQIGFHYEFRKANGLWVGEWY